MKVENRFSEHAKPREAKRRTVLVVNDSLAQRRMLAIQLTRGGYDVAEVASAAAALEYCYAVGHPDIVLSDWVMPGMSGITLCRRLRALQKSDYIYFILLTARTSPSDVAEGFEAGADDFLTKPVSWIELHARLRAGERMLRLQERSRAVNRRLSRAIKALRASHAAMQHDLEEARHLQLGLVSTRPASFGDFNVTNLLCPAGDVGGDLVGSFPINARKFGVYAIDVSGHGIVSALLTARLASQFSASVDQNVALIIDDLGLYDSRPPVELARYLNHTMLNDLNTERYFTLIYAVIDRLTGEVRMVQAGHPHPLLQRADGSFEQLGQGGLPIGLVPDATHEEIRFTIRPGDRLLIASDGVWEAEDDAGRILGAEGLCRFMQRNSALSGRVWLDSLARTVSARDDGEMRDDVSAVLIENIPPAPEHTTQAPAPMTARHVRRDQTGPFGQDPT